MKQSNTTEKINIEAIKETTEFKELVYKCIMEKNDFWYGVVIHWNVNRLERCRVSENENLHNVSKPIVLIKYGKMFSKGEIVKYY